MSVGSSVLTVFASLCVSGLAVGAAVGAHTLVGEPAAAASASPSTGSEDDFCALMAQLRDVGAELDEDSTGTVIPDDQAAWDDPAVLDSLHAFGRTLLDVADSAAGMERQASGMVADADVAAAFATLADATEAQGMTLGQPAIDAESVGDYVSAVFEAALDPETNALMERADDAATTVADYVRDECDIDLDTGATTDDAAKADVSALGKEVATYYVGWEEGDPVPVVTVEDGQYFLLDTAIGPVADGVDLTDQYANGPTDWCVEVTAADSLTAYSYSAAQGLADDTCATLSAAS